jgi:hypothetical protein
MIMKDFITSMITLILFITAVGLFYAAITVTYPSVFINLVLVIISIFVLLQGCERLDKAYELGEYADDDDNVNNEEM